LTLTRLTYSNTAKSYFVAIMSPELNLDESGKMFQKSLDKVREGLYTILRMPMMIRNNTT
jgi:hypothetical protein